MGEKKIDIVGEEYISSARAAELVGYTKDYVGQLARDGKIDATRVGRNWYIKESSIRDHKLSVHYTLTKPKKTKAKAGAETAPPTTQQEAIVEDKTDEIPINRAIEREVLKTYEEKPVVKEGAFSQKNNTRKVSDDNVVFEPYVVEKEEHDLFPSTMKRDTDVLTKTDIRYEREKPKTTPQPVIHSDGFRTVPVRKPTMAGIVKKERQHEHPQDNHTQQIRPRNSDYVVMDGVSDLRLRKERYIQPALRQQEEHYEDGQYEEEYYERRPRRRRARGEISKVVPVVGAIIVFTIFAVFFILISS